MSGPTETRITFEMSSDLDAQIEVIRMAYERTLNADSTVERIATLARSLAKNDNELTYFGRMIARKVAHSIYSSRTTSASPLTTTQARAFLSAEKFIDLILEPEAAESAIANLDEGFQRRTAVEGGHARRWLWAQVGWIMFGRALDVVRSVVRARAGK